MMEESDKTIRFIPEFFNMPTVFVFNKNLTKLSIALYQCIRMMGHSKKGCWASNGYFAAMFDVHPMTISNSISSLKKEGLVEETKYSQHGGMRYLKATEKFQKENMETCDKIRERIQDYLDSRPIKMTDKIMFEEMFEDHKQQDLGGINGDEVSASRLREAKRRDLERLSVETDQLRSSILEVEDRKVIVSSSKEEEWTREASGSVSSQENKWRKEVNIPTQPNNKYLDNQNIQRLPDNNSTDTLKKESKVLRKCSSYKNDSAPVEIVDKWESLGFPKVDAKYRLSTLSKIEDLMRGDFFEDKLLENGNSKYSHRPFTKDEILSAIENRARGAFDFNYAPTTKKSKQSMSKLPMSVWIYNSNGGVSYFLKDFEKPYKKIPEKLRLIDDEYPDYTESIIEKYTEEILYNVAPKEWSIKDLNSFRKSAQRLREYFVDIEDRSRHIRLHEIERQIDVLIRALREHYGQDEEDEGAKIHPTNLCSDFTFNRILPNYMGRQRMLSGKNLIG